MDENPRRTGSALRVHQNGLINPKLSTNILNDPFELRVTKYFGRDVRRYLAHVHRHTTLRQLDDTDTATTRSAATSTNTTATATSEIAFTDEVLQRVMEPHIEKARQSRNKAQRETVPWVVPYPPALRRQQTLHFSRQRFPLQQCFSRLMGVENLALLHEVATSNKEELLQPLLDAQARLEFQRAYECLVKNFVIPYLHRRIHALGWHDSADDDSNQYTSSLACSFRYQTFPCIRVVRPGEFSIGPHCDLAYGHSIASLNFHVPLTPTQGTNALYVESAPRKEDWHPLLWQGPAATCGGENGNDQDDGVVFLFDGAQCLHFTLENTTPFTRVSIDFRVALSATEGNNDLIRDGATNDDHVGWQDRYSTPSGYYSFCKSTLSGKDTIYVEALGEETPSVIDRRVGFPF